MRRYILFVAGMLFAALAFCFGCASGLESSGGGTPQLRASAIGSDYGYLSGEVTSWIRVTADLSGNFAYASLDNRKINESTYGTNFRMPDLNLAEELLFDESIVISPVEVFVPGAYNGSGREERVAGLCLNGDGDLVTIVRGGYLGGSGYYKILVLKDGVWKSTSVPSYQWGYEFINLDEPHDMYCDDSRVHLTSGLGDDFYYTYADDEDSDGIYETLGSIYKVNSVDTTRAQYSKVIATENYVYVIFRKDVTSEGGHGLVYFARSDRERISFEESTLISGSEENIYVFSAVSPNEDTIYVTMMKANEGYIKFTRSTNGGLTWSAPTKIHDLDYSSGTEGYLRQIGSIITTEVGGQIIVLPMWKTTRGVSITMSADGGATWPATDYGDMIIDKGADYYDYENRSNVRAYLENSTIHLVVSWDPNEGSEPIESDDATIEYWYASTDDFIFHKADLESYMTGIGVPKTSFWVYGFIAPYDGETMVIWSNSTHDESQGGDMVGAFWDGSAFSGYGGVNLAENSYQAYSDIILDDEENYYVVTVDNRGDSGGDIYVAVFDSGIDASKAPVKISGGEPGESYGRFSPILAFDKLNDLVYTFYSNSTHRWEHQSDIYVTKSDDRGSSWSSVQRVTSFDGREEPLSAAIDSSGRAYVLSSLREPDAHMDLGLNVTASSDGINWSEAGELLFPANTMAINGRILVNSKGKLFVLASLLSDSYDFEIFMWTSENGGSSWSSHVVLETSSFGTLAIDENDKLTLVHSDVETFSASEGITGSWYFKQSADDGVTWSSRTLIDNMNVSLAFTVGVSADLEVGIDGSFIFGALKFVEGTNRAYIYLFY